MANRTMYDSVTVANLPVEPGALYAGYVDGNWPNFIQISQQFRKSRVVSIAVQANADAQVLDVEAGDATADQAPAWVVRQRNVGRKRPTIYTSRSNFSTVIAAFNAAKVALPDFWIADWTGAAHSVSGAVAVQFASNDKYDTSCITDAHWPDAKPTVIHRVIHAPKKVVKRAAHVVKKAAHVVKKVVKKVVHKPVPKPTKKP